MSSTITFVALATSFVPVVNGMAVVKVPSLNDERELVGETPFATLTTDDDRARAKAEARLRTGRWMPAVKLTAKGNLPKVIKVDWEALKEARVARQAELNAETAARREAEKAERAAAKAAEPAKAAPKARKAGTEKTRQSGVSAKTAAIIAAAVTAALQAVNA